MSVDCKELDIESEIWHILDGKALELRYLTINHSSNFLRLEKNWKSRVLIGGVQTYRETAPIVWSDVAIRREQWRTHRIRCAVFTRTLHPLGSSLSLSPNARIPSKIADRRKE